jgi:hypothetical protein
MISSTVVRKHTNSHVPGFDGILRVDVAFSGVQRPNRRPQAGEQEQHGCQRFDEHSDPAAVLEPSAMIRVIRGPFSQVRECRFEI